MIPESYIPDVPSRLVLYKRIANAKHEAGLEDLSVELIDRFGLLPEQTQHLFKIAALKLQAEALGICKIDAGPKGGRFEFGAVPKVDPRKIIDFIQKMPSVYSLEGPQKFRFKLDLSNIKTRIEEVRKVMDRLDARQK